MAASTVELGRGIHWHMFRWWKAVLSALFSAQSSSPVRCSFSQQPSHGKDSLNTRQEVANPAALYSRSAGLWMELSDESFWTCVFDPTAHPTLPGQMRKEDLKPQVLTDCGRASYRNRSPCQHAGYSNAEVMHGAGHA